MPSGMRFVGGGGGGAPTCCFVRLGCRGFWFVGWVVVWRGVCGVFFLLLVELVILSLLLF